MVTIQLHLFLRAENSHNLGTDWAQKAKRGPNQLPSNATKLLAHLETNLKRDDFKAINQTGVSAAIGIPLGSMTASLERLVETRLIQAGGEGGYKLV